MFWKSTFLSSSFEIVTHRFLWIESHVYRLDIFIQSRSGSLLLEQSLFPLQPLKDTKWMTFLKVLIQPFIMSWIRHFKSASSVISKLWTCSSSSLFLHLASSSRPLSGQPGGTNQVTLNLTERYFWRLAATNLNERGIQNQLRLKLVEIYLSNWQQSQSNIHPKPVLFHLPLHHYLEPQLGGEL